MTPLDARRRRILQLALPMAAYLAILPYAATHLDLARDIYVGLLVARGDEAPLLGPLLAGAFHLGPLWYYVLAVPIFFGAGWFAILLFIAAVGALQFPLAYLAGKALHSRAAGITWAWLLLLPSWSTFESLFPEHTQWTATCVLAAIVSALRFHATNKARYFIALALACALAVHAHPSAAGVAWVGLGVLVLGLRRGSLGPVAIASASLALLVPFLPMLIDQVSRGLPLLRETGSYLDSGQGAIDVSVAPALLVQSLVGGMKYWFGTILGVKSLAATALAVSFGVVCVVGGFGFAIALREPGFRRPGIWAALASVALLLTDSLLRAYFPYYMTTVVRVAALGLIAVGLARLLGPRLRTALVLVSLALHLGVVLGVAVRQSRGAWPLAYFPLFDVVGKERQAPRPVLKTPAYAMSRSGSFLCQGALQVHGAYAWHVLHGHALEARLACKKIDVVIGGPAEAGRAQWIGFSRALLQDASIVPQVSLGPIGLLPARQVFGESVAVVSPERPQYPPVQLADRPLAMRVFEFPVADGERLAISNLAFPFTWGAEPVVTVYAGGKSLEPVGGDALSRIWRCEDCGSANWRIEVTAGDLRYLNVVKF